MEMEMASNKPMLLKRRFLIDSSLESMIDKYVDLEVNKYCCTGEDELPTVLGVL